MNSNIEKFDVLVAQVFAKLYQAFPVPVGLPADEYGVEVERIFGNPSSIDSVTLSELDFFCSTVRWLESSGYLTYQSEADSGVFFSVSLTAKGLEVLKSTPASLSVAKTLGEYIVDGTKTGVRDAMTKGASYALSAGAALAWNAVLTAVR